MRFLNAAAVCAALPMTVAIDAMRTAFTALARGEVEMPLRTQLELPGGGAVALVMPATARSAAHVAAKMVTVCPRNRDQGLPRLHGLVIVFYAETGEPHGVLEGTALTAIRTGAASGLATDLLALPDATRVAIIGSGAQARTQLEAVCSVREVTHVAVHSRARSHAAAFAREMAERPGVSHEIRVASSVADAVDGAHVICTATSSPVPVLGAGEVHPGSHINAIGSYRPDMQEIAPGLLRESRIIVDDRDAALAEAGEIIEGVNHGVIELDQVIELGEVVTGVDPGRERNDQITLFKSVGLAVQDLYAAAAALDRAEREGIGTVFDL